MNLCVIYRVLASVDVDSAEAVNKVFASESWIVTIGVDTFFYGQGVMSMVSGTVLRVGQIVYGVVAIFIVVLAYAFFHEGGHALAVLAQGGQVTVFSLNFLSGSPHIRYTGEISDMGRAIVSIAGPLVPILVWLPMVPFMAKLRQSLLQGILLLYSMAAISSLLPSIIMSLLYWQGSSVNPREDVVRFLQFSGADPLITAAALCALTIFSVWYLIRVGKMIPLLASWRERLFLSSIPTPAARIIGLSIMIISLLVGFSIVWRSTTPHALLDLTQFDQAVELRFEEFDANDQVVYAFTVTEPIVYDMGYALTTQIPVRLQLVNMSGTGFLYRDGNVFIIYEGSDILVNARFSGFMLQPGEYQIELITSDRQGDLQLGITKREPVAREFAYAEVLDAIQRGTFTGETYQEDGYVLMYHEPLTDGQEQVLYELGPRTDVQWISVFVIGDYEELLFSYREEETTITLLRNFNATIEFGLPPSQYTGELVLSAEGVDGEMFLYLLNP